MSVPNHLGEMLEESHGRRAAILKPGFISAQITVVGGTILANYSFFESSKLFTSYYGLLRGESSYTFRFELKLFETGLLSIFSSDPATYTFALHFNLLICNNFKHRYHYVTC